MPAGWRERDREGPPAGGPLRGAGGQRAERHGRRGASQRGGGVTMQVTMTVNGEEVSREIEPRLLLIHFVRDHLGLTGTHWGCDTSNCGTCVLWMDGTPVKSCT